MYVSVVHDELNENDVPVPPAGTERQQHLGGSGDAVGEMPQPDVPESERKQNQRAQHSRGFGKRLET